MIKNETKYTSKLVKEFLHIYYFDRVKVPRIIMNILILIVIVRYFIIPDITKIDTITFIFSLFGIIELNTNLLPNINYQRLKKKKNSILDKKITYLFKEHNFSITTDKEEYINYKDLYKVIETNNIYCLYINREQAFIVDKENISNEDQNKLKTYLTTNISNYKRID